MVVTSGRAALAEAGRDVMRPIIFAGASRVNEPPRPHLARGRPPVGCRHPCQERIVMDRPEPRPVPRLSSNPSRMRPMAGLRDLLDEPTPGRRSRVRYAVLAFTVALAAITYLDRVCIAHAGVTASIKAELGLSDKQMSLVYSAFTLAYALFEMPTGAWGDRIGPRRVLTRIVLWWSCFTIATASAFHYRTLLLIRFLFGAGEAGAFPNVTKTFSRWFPIAERGTAQGIFFAGAHLGGGLTPMVVTVLLGVLPWRAIFVLFGSIGFVWAGSAWWTWFRVRRACRNTRPSTRASGNTSGVRARRGILRTIGSTPQPLRRILADRSLVALCLMYFTQAYGFYFNITWLPTYLARDRGLTTERLGLVAGVFAGLPRILSARGRRRGRSHDRRDHPQLWTTRGAMRGRGRRGCDRGRRPDRRGDRPRPDRGGPPDCGLRRRRELLAWGLLGRLPGHRRAACRSRLRLHEYRGPARRRAESDHPPYFVDPAVPLSVSRGCSISSAPRAGCSSTRASRSGSMRFEFIRCESGQPFEAVAQRLAGGGPLPTGGK